MAAKTVYLHSLGCDKNLVDSELMLGLLYEAGYKSEAEPSKAGLIVVNTCGFIQEAVEEAIEVILEMAAHKIDAGNGGACQRLIVSGCMAQRYRQQLAAEIPEIDEILGVNDFPKITGQTVDVLDDSLYQKRAQTMPMHVAYVKISEGCDNHCTYCTIPQIRGPYRDRAFESIIDECKRLLKGGARELVLIAQDTARYGMQKYGKQRLHELMAAITKIEPLDDLVHLRLMYAYPEHVYNELIDTISKHNKICNYIDMPIQHSSDSVIKRMGRKSTSEGLRLLIKKLRSASIAIRSTLIVGFPGETDEEFEELYDFVTEAKFDHLGVFTYSKEEGTPAATMKPQVPKAIKQKRQETLMLLQAKIADENGQKLIGQQLTVMVDGSIAPTTYSGRSQRDAYDVDGAIFFESTRELMSGDTVQIRIVSAKNYDLYGELMD